MLVGFSVTTDQNGQFRIEHPGAVIQFRKEKLKPKAVFTAITHRCIGRARFCLADRCKPLSLGYSSCPEVSSPSPVCLPPSAPSDQA